MECEICGDILIRCDECGEFYCPECSFCLCWEVYDEEIAKQQLKEKEIK